MAGPSAFREHAESILAEVAVLRASITPKNVEFLGAKGVSDPGKHYSNYASMIFNRMVSLYDDCVLLLDNERTASACVLSRCILETYAVAEFSKMEVIKSFNKDGIDGARDTILSYVNSSRIKQEEQKRLKQGIFATEDYHFTAEALERMADEAAVSKHILNAMRHLFKLEMTKTGRPESRYEMIYEQLSEWTHPSQTSLFHAFATDTWMIETRLGKISLWDGALAACTEAMRCITALPELCAEMNGVAQQLSRAFEKIA